MEADGLPDNAVLLHKRYAAAKHAEQGLRDGSVLIIGTTEIVWSTHGELGETVVKNAPLVTSREREQSTFQNGVAAEIVLYFWKVLSVEHPTMDVNKSVRMAFVPAFLVLTLLQTKRIALLKIAKCRGHHIVPQVLHSAASVSTPMPCVQEEKLLILSRVR